MDYKESVSGAKALLAKKNKSFRAKLEFVEVKKTREVDIDEFHTREEISSGEKPRIKGPMENKETWFDTYLINIRESFEMVLLPTFTLPDLKNLDASDAIRELGSCFQTNDFEVNLLTYWILETFFQVLKECQEENMFDDNQRMTVMWITYILHQIAVYGFKRAELFKHLEDLLGEAQNLVEAEGPIPNPFKLSRHLAVPILEITKDGKSIQKTRGPPSYRKYTKKLNTLSNIYEQNKLEMEKKQRRSDFFSFIEKIYSIFADRFKYEVIREVLYNPQPIETLTICENILRPKDYKCPFKRKPSKIELDTPPSLHLASPAKKVKSKNVQSKDSSRSSLEKKKFIQKILKEVNEPIMHMELEKKETTPLPCLQPLSHAVKPSFLIDTAWQRDTTIFSVSKHLRSDGRSHSF